jgi:hypothetical protein
MLRKTIRRLFKRLKILLAALGLGLGWILFSGCTAFQKPEDQQELLLKSGPIQKVFFVKYETLWRAVHQVLKYPIAAENQDTGLIETEYVKMADGFIHPVTGKPPTRGTRYRFVFKLIKGKVSGRASVRVVIDKQIELLKNFFSDPERIPSDELEELSLIYRIERELMLTETLEKANK